MTTLVRAVLDPGLVWAAALLLIVAGAVGEARRTGFDPGAMYWMCLWALAGGLAGGHAGSLLVRGVPAPPLEWLRFWEGPRSSFGGIAGGALASALFLRARRLPAPAYADAATPSLALGYALGRLGCLLNGDDFGAVSALPWAVRHPAGTLAYETHLARGWIAPEASASLPVHPWPLYSAAVGLGLFVLLRRAPPWPGGRVAVAAVGYGAARFVLEFLRGDDRAMLGPLSVSHLMSLALLATGMAMWMRARRGGGAVAEPIAAVASVRTASPSLPPALASLGAGGAEGPRP